MKSLPDNYVLVCPECQRECWEDHNSFGCNVCQRLWPKGAGHEQYKKKSTHEQKLCLDSKSGGGKLE